MTPLTLEKYEGLGNDFLVLIDLDRSARYDAELAVALCDRHRGVGADGLVRLSRGSVAELRFELLNADGSFAETSGNGLRCAVLAALDDGIIDSSPVSIETSGPVATASFEGREADGSARLRVTMGAAAVAETPSPLPMRRAFQVDVGNPHLVLIGATLDDVDLAVVGPELEAAVSGGQNVEVIRVVDRGRIELVVWERGAGLTEACGSGTVAAAAAAYSIGLVDEEVDVDNPGGQLHVSLAGSERARPEVALAGTARRVASVAVEVGDLVGSGQ